MWDAHGAGWRQCSPVHVHALVLEERRPQGHQERCIASKAPPYPPPPRVPPVSRAPALLLSLSESATPAPPLVPPWKLSQPALCLPPVAASPSRSLAPLLTCCDLLWFQILPLVALLSCHFQVQTLKTGTVTSPARLCRPVASMLADQPWSATASFLGPTGVMATVVSTQRAGTLAGGSSTTGPQGGFCEPRGRGRLRCLLEAAPRRRALKTGEIKNLYQLYQSIPIKQIF